MKSFVTGGRMIKRIGWLALALLLPLVILAFTLRAMASGIQPRSHLAEQFAPPVYLPSVFSTESIFRSPAGVYQCLEYEFGLIWTTEVITLNADGSSIYNYAPPYTGMMTGSWVYTPANQLVGFTNFRWLTATYAAPERLWARRYLPQVDFEIALECLRQ